MENEFCGYIEQNKLSSLTVVKLRSFAQAKDLCKGNALKGNLIAMIEEFFK